MFNAPHQSRRGTRSCLWGHAQSPVARLLLPGRWPLHAAAAQSTGGPGTCTTQDSGQITVHSHNSIRYVCCTHTNLRSTTDSQCYREKKRVKWLKLVKWL